MSDERMGLAGTLALLAITVAVLFGVALTGDGEAPARVADSTGPGAGATLDSDELLELSLRVSPAVARRAY